MPKLISSETTLQDTWVLVDDAPVDGNFMPDTLLPLDYFLANSDAVDSCAVWLSSSDDPYSLEKHLDKINVVAFKFENFVDGRSFSQARILREHLDYGGRIRAIGNFIQDQLHYLLRCGFDEFSVADDADENSIRESMADFSESYQAACDVAAPLFRRRA